jgi:hypothetical protein
VVCAFLAGQKSGQWAQVALYLYAGIDSGSEERPSIGGEGWADGDYTKSLIRLHMRNALAALVSRA